MHATLGIGEVMLMVHDESPTLASRAPQADGSSSVVIYLYIDAVDTVIERARTAGATVQIPVADQYWGDRMGRLVDPAGHVWNVATRP
jgi:PhnB protein